MANGDKPMVLVTGGTGYIAAHVVNLLQQDNYPVRASVRSLSDTTKVDDLRNLHPDTDQPLQLVEADLLDADSWVAAVKDCKYVLHIASPLPADVPREEKEIIDPAVKGTLAVLKACRDEGVQRVVLTSSTQAVTSGSEHREGLFTEEDWTDPEQVPWGAYIKSKTLAERAAWDFVEALPDHEKFELVVLNPGYVVGPVLCGAFSTSMISPRRMLQHEDRGLLNYSFGMVDVRDVAQAHVNAMVAPHAAGHRHLLVTETLFMKDMALILDAEFMILGYEVPIAVWPDVFVVVMGVLQRASMGLLERSLQIITPILGVRAEFDTRRMKEVLGITPRTMKDSIIDMAYSMIEGGYVEKTGRYIYRSKML